MFRWVSAGESHGASLLGIVEGVPAGVQISTDDLRRELARRRGGHGRGARQRFEADEVRFVGGVRHGLTTGAPVAIQIFNTEWPKWTAVMSADPVDPAQLQCQDGRGDQREIARNQPLTRPRPGHADFAGMLKYGHDDARNVLERALARETAMRVALGAVAKAVLAQCAQVQIVSAVTAIGDQTSADLDPRPEQAQSIEASPVRHFDPHTQARFIAAIDQAKAAGQTVGGAVRVAAWSVPIGLGSHTQWDTRLDAHLAAALMSIPSAKAVEIGHGIDQSAVHGGQAHDQFSRVDGELTRQTNRAGGIEGGMSTGAPVSARVFFKPIATVPHPLQTVDLATGALASANHQRSDICQVVPAAVIAEAMMALTLAQALTDAYGTDQAALIGQRVQQAQERHQGRMHSTKTADRLGGTP